MSISTLILILVSVSLSALAQVSFKFGVAVPAVGVVGQSAMAKLLHTLTTPGIMVGLGLYGFGTVLWLSALRRVEVSQAYPFVGLGFVLTTLLGHVLFGDALNLQRVCGILVVIGGIALVAQS